MFFVPAPGTIAQLVAAAAKASCMGAPDLQGAGFGRSRCAVRALQGMVAMNLYLYGDRADERVARETPLRQAWLRNADGDFR
jgi:hypothetical protein